MDIACVSLVELRRQLDAGEVTSAEAVRACLDRIDAHDRRGPAIHAMLQVSPEAEAIADNLDHERRHSGPRGPLHGIPIIVKDNIDTADGMETTAGSLALLGSRPREDAPVVSRLRAAGAVILGKANMSEWANFRSRHSSSGWSARGGQARNPYVLDRSACGSSTGSASAVAAGYAPASLGTETSGSILCPGAMNGVVGIKPTVGLTSRTGVIPISHSQDTVGPFARSVADAALVLAAIAGPHPRDPATANAPANLLEGLVLDAGALRGARIGAPRKALFGYNPKVDALVDTALAVLREQGAELVDPADLPSIDRIESGHHMLEVLLYEFKANLDAYLSTRGGQITSLAELIEFNRTHAVEEMPYFGQDLFELAQAKGPLTDSPYLEALATCRRLSRDEGIDAVMNEHRVDALVAPTTGPAWLIDLVNGDAGTGGCAHVPAMAGYPAITVPVGFVSELPVGITFFGRAFSEPMLLSLAYAFEQATTHWRPPRFLATATA